MESIHFKIRHGLCYKCDRLRRTNHNDILCAVFTRRYIAIHAIAKRIEKNIHDSHKHTTTKLHAKQNR